MHSQIPEPLRALVEQLARLPGLGPKSAMRVAMTLLKWPEAETRRLGKGIHDLRDNLHLCSRCGGLSATDPCAGCKDENRARDTLCLVNEWDSKLTLDEGGFYHGQYMILGGLLAPLANMDSDSLDLDRLISRLEEGEVHELILALGATIDAENTASFIRNLVRKRFPHIRVSRLAQGIPLGAEVKYMDRETLRQSLQYRQDIEASRHVPDGKGSLAQGALSFFHARDSGCPAPSLSRPGISPQERPRAALPLPADPGKVSSSRRHGRMTGGCRSGGRGRPQDMPLCGAPRELSPHSPLRSYRRPGRHPGAGYVGPGPTGAKGERSWKHFSVIPSCSPCWPASFPGSRSAWGPVPSSCAASFPVWPWTACWGPPAA